MVFGHKNGKIWVKKIIYNGRNPFAKHLTDCYQSDDARFWTDSNQSKNFGPYFILLKQSLFHLPLHAKQYLTAFDLPGLIIDLFNEKGIA